MNKNEFPILGKGTRPKGAQDCDFINLDNRISYGMPSGHSQISALFGTFMILMIINGRYSDKLKIIKCLFIFVLTMTIMISRIHFKCHTFQQVAVGGIIGIVIGFATFFNMRNIKTYLHL